MQCPTCVCLSVAASRKNYINRKLSCRKENVRLLRTKFSGSRGRPPRTIFARIAGTVLLFAKHLSTSDSECLTTLPLRVFTQRNFVADFFSSEVHCTQKTAFMRFKPSLEEGVA